MPDNKNENKLLAMLERRGYLAKKDAGEEADQPEPGSALSNPEADLRYLFNTPDSNDQKVTPAARQPVPGFPTPIIPAERKTAAERVEPHMTERVMPLNTQLFERENPEPPKPFGHEQPQPADFMKPVPVSSGLDFDNEEGSVMTKEPATYPVETRPFERPQPAENYTERYLDIEELYEALALRSKRTDTIYLIEEYMKTLPDSLPDESRREIVSKLIAASGFDYDLLTGDGVLRVKMLKDYAERFAQYTEDYVSARQTELEELDQQMARVRRLIEIRRDLHKKQFFAIETEAQRLKEILTFISG